MMYWLALGENDYKAYKMCIRDRHYADAFALRGKTMEKIGMNFMIDEDKTIVLDCAK